MSQIAIQVEGLSKRYRIGVQESSHETFAAAATSWLKSPLINFRRLRSLSRFDEIEAVDILWALRNISFSVRQGEVIGVIGNNGAGKSTLLKILSRITPPSEGRIILNGRVASLLEVGTGFHPELTGRENVYLNGTILGMRKTEIDRKFDEIIAFSGVEKFIDTPVKRYSSGMRVRLAFSVAAHLEPEILLVDEVLAVGDAAFQKQCLGKMQDVAQTGRTVVFVSHDMVAIQQLCQRVHLLENGRITNTGDPFSIVSDYLKTTALTHSVISTETPRKGTGRSLIKTVRVTNMSGEAVNAIPMGASLNVEICFEVIEGSILFPSFGVGVRNARGIRVLRATTFETYGELPEATSGGRVHLQLRNLNLMPGAYRLTFGISDRGEQLDLLSNALDLEITPYPVYPSGKIPSQDKDFIIFADCEWAHEYS
ncbi:MAG: ABC transporter ATP-binding protein [Anaerolineales bacterium]|nr:ABC transporter ATP-binding protein [Anaerolineales bacterium]